MLINKALKHLFYRLRHFPLPQFLLETSAVPIRRNILELTFEVNFGIFVMKVFYRIYYEMPGLSDRLCSWRREDLSVRLSESCLFRDHVLSQHP